MDLSDDMRVLCSLHQTIVNKPKTKEEEEKLGTRWQAQKGIAPDVFIESITKQGKAFAGIFRYGHKRKKFYMGSNIIALDIDNEGKQQFSLTDAICDTYIRDHAWFIYTSPSHSKSDVDKYRIVFLLEKPVLDGTDYERIVSELLVMYPAADKSCSDCSRLFYGNAGAVVKRFNKVLTIESFEALSREARKRSSVPTFLSPCKKVSPEQYDELAQEIGLLLSYCQDWYGKGHPGEYKDWRDICFAVLDALPSEQGVDLICDRWGEECRADASAMLQGQLRLPAEAERITIKTLLHHAKKNPEAKNTWRQFVEYDEIPLIMGMIKGEEQVKQPAAPLIEGFNQFVIARSNMKIERIKTTIKEIDDEMNGGLSPFGITMLAGPTGFGKSSLAFQIAYQRACIEKLPVIYYALELGKWRAYARIICQQRKLSWDDILLGRLLPDRDYEHPVHPTDPLYIYDQLNSVSEVKKTVDRISGEFKVPPLIVIDYLQYLTPVDNTNLRHYLEQQSKGLIDISKELAVPILALSSMPNDKVGEFRKPRADFNCYLATTAAKESGRFGYEADTCMAIALSRDDQNNEALFYGYLVVGKNRSGSSFADSQRGVKYEGEFGSWSSCPNVESYLQNHNVRQQEVAKEKDENEKHRMLKYIADKKIRTMTELKTLMKPVGKNKVEGLITEIRLNGYIRKLDGIYCLTREGKDKLHVLESLEW